MAKSRKFIVGNWKMNGLAANLEAIRQIDAQCSQFDKARVAICPPATLITQAANNVSQIEIGAQDCHQAEKGAHTGCLSAAMIKEAGAGFSIIGHSERRADQHESDADVAAKAVALHAAGMGAILCVGETLEQRDSGHAVDIVCAQLKASLPLNARPDWLTIAYEPVWAIGTGRVPLAADIAQMHAALRQTLVTTYGDTGADFAILYGGSVKGDNAREILGIADVGGALVGGASLTVDAFIPIVAAC